ncbi:hypothetical protein [Bacteroides faecis]|uniref:hypothetical protein n=1 Tax=Bacteroides faecis TaxID=674529 RepID=UPI00286E33B4|nr:hypothetical protein [Bacteroides faecis]MCS2235174.1 hypothetical protein [Bacteroides faecis]
MADRQIFRHKNSGESVFFLSSTVFAIGRTALYAMSACSHLIFLIALLFTPQNYAFLWKRANIWRAKSWGRKERIVNAINYLSEKLFSELSHDNEKTDDRQKVKGKECGYYDN